MADTTLPQLLALTFTDSLDVSSGYANLTISAEASDDNAIDRVIVYFNQDITYAYSANDVAPDATYSFMGMYGTSDSWDDGKSSITNTVFNTNDNGTYTITKVVVEDTSGNKNSYDTDALASMGISTSIEISGATPDNTGPTLTSFSLTSIADVSNGSANIIFSADASDDIAGIDDVVVYFDKDISYTHGSDAASPSSTYSFVGLYGIYDSWDDNSVEETKTVFDINEEGIYTISKIVITDLADNSTTYLTSELETLGFSTSFEIIGANPDTTGPTLTNFNMEDILDISLGPANLTFDVTASDDNAGVDDVVIYFDQTISYAHGANAIASTSNYSFIGLWGIYDSWDDGAALETKTIFDTNPTGLYTISKIVVTDLANNSTTYTTQNLIDLGYNTTFELVDGKVAGNTLPTGGATLRGIFQVGEEITVTNDIADVDGLGTFNFQWYRNDTIIDGANEETYTSTMEDFGKRLSVLITYTDQAGSVENVKSDASEFINAPSDIFIETATQDSAGIDTYYSDFDTFLTNNSDSIANLTISADNYGFAHVTSGTTYAFDYDTYSALFTETGLYRMIITPDDPSKFTSNQIIWGYFASGSTDLLMNNINTYKDGSVATEAFEISELGNSYFTVGFRYSDDNREPATDAPERYKIEIVPVTVDPNASFTYITESVEQDSAGYDTYYSNIKDLLINDTGLIATLPLNTATYAYSHVNEGATFAFDYDTFSTDITETGYYQISITPDDPSKFDSNKIIWSFYPSGSRDLVLNSTSDFANGVMMSDKFEVTETGEMFLSVALRYRDQDGVAATAIPEGYIIEINKVEVDPNATFTFTDETLTKDSAGFDTYYSDINQLLINDSGVIANLPVNVETTAYSHVPAGSTFAFDHDTFASEINTTGYYQLVITPDDPTKFDSNKIIWSYSPTGSRDLLLNSTGDFVDGSMYSEKFEISETGQTFFSVSMRFSDSNNGSATDTPEKYTIKLVPIEIDPNATYHLMNETLTEDSAGFDTFYDDISDVWLLDTGNVASITVGESSQAYSHVTEGSSFAFDFDTFSADVTETGFYQVVITPDDPTLFDSNKILWAYDEIGNKDLILNSLSDFKGGSMVSEQFEVVSATRLFFSLGMRFAPNDNRVAGADAAGYSFTLKKIGDSIPDDNTTELTISINESLTLDLETRDDVDWLQLNPTSAEPVIVSLTSTEGVFPTIEGFYDNNGDVLAIDATVIESTTTSYQVLITELSAPFFMAVSADNTSPASIDVSVALSNISDDFSDDINSTALVTLSAPLSGTIELPADIDWIGFAANTGETLKIDVTGSGENPLNDPDIIGIYDSNGELVSSDNEDDVIGSLDSRSLFTPDSNGNYFVAVGSGQASSGQYSVSLQNYTPNNEEVSEEQVKTLTLDATKPHALVRFTADSDGYYQFDLTSASIGFDPLIDGVFDSAGQLKRFSFNDDFAGDKNARIVLSLTAGEQISLKVSSNTQDVTADATLSVQSIIVDDAIGDEPSTAAILTETSDQASTIDYSGDVDLFEITTTIGHDYTLTITGNGENSLSDSVILGVFNSAGELLPESFNDDSATDNLHASSAFLATETTYYVAVSGYSGSIGGYALNLSDNYTESTDPNDRFNITIKYSGDDNYRSYFDEAAAIWEDIIISDIPDVYVNGQLVDDIVIEASVSSIDGPSRILAQDSHIDSH